MVGTSQKLGDFEKTIVMHYKHTIATAEFETHLHEYAVLAQGAQHTLECQNLERPTPSNISSLIGTDPPKAFVECTGSSVLQRFKTHIAPAVNKFLGIKAMTQKESGCNDDQYFCSCNACYMKQNGGTSFEKFRECKEYLKDKPKQLCYKQTNHHDTDEKTKCPKGTKTAKKEAADKAEH